MATKLKTKACATCGGSGSVVSDEAGPILREEREKLGIQLKQMAAAIGISESYLHDLERGNRRWANDVFNAYQKVLKEGVPA